MFSKKSDKLNRYVDPTGEFTNQELKLSEWYISHKLLLRKILIWCLTAWSIISLTYGVGYFVYYLIFGYSQDQQIYNSLVLDTPNYDSLKAYYKPQDLQVQNVQVFDSAKDKFDFVAPAYNPNERWVASITYKFKYGGGETESRQTIILPGEKRPIIFFGQTAAAPGSVQLVLEKVDWQNISRHEVPDIAQFMKDRLQFRFDDFKFISAGSVNSLASAVQFTLYNDSAYNYLRPEFYVELRNDNGVQGYLYFIEDKFGRAEKRLVDLRSMVDNLDINDIAIYPMVNVFDRAQYVGVSE